VALLSLGRLEECEQALATGLAAARDQALPYEEALLLQVRARLERTRGDEAAWAADARAAQGLLTRLGAQAAGPWAPSVVRSDEPTCA
jgi:hypothetical protein